MNTTVGSTWKGIKLHHLTAVGGAVLAVAAFVSIDTQPKRPPAPAPAGAGLSMISSPGTFDTYTYYLVGSEAERDSLMESPDGDYFLLDHTWVVVVQDLADEIRMAHTQAELTALGHSALITDLRHR